MRRRLSLLRAPSISALLALAGCVSIPPEIHEVFAPPAPTENSHFRLVAGAQSPAAPPACEVPSAPPSATPSLPSGSSAPAASSAPVSPSPSSAPVAPAPGAAP